MTDSRPHVIVIRTVDDEPVVFRTTSDPQREPGPHGVVFTVDRTEWDRPSSWTLKSRPSVQPVHHRHRRPRRTASGR